MIVPQVPFLPPCSSTPIRSPGLNTEIDGYINALEGLIMATRRQLSLLRQEKNATLPAINVPDEILLDIFGKYAPVNEVSEVYYRMLRTLRLVSCRWAALIATSPTMWTRISSLNRKDTQQALKLSRTAPIHVYYRPGTDFRFAMPTEQYVPLVQRHANRWGALELETGDAGTIKSFLQTPVGSLRFLSLKTERRLDVGTITVAVFAGSSPALKSIKLEKCNLPWTLINTAALETLELRDIAIGIEDVATILRAASALRSLRIYRLKGSGELQAETSGFGTVRLPNLKSISFDGPFTHVAQLLNCMYAPNVTTLAMHDNHAGVTFPHSLSPWIHQVAETSTARNIGLSHEDHSFQFLCGGLDISSKYPKGSDPRIVLIQEVLAMLPTSLRASITSAYWTSYRHGNAVFPLVLRAFPNMSCIWYNGGTDHLDDGGPPLTQLTTLRVLRRDLDHVLAVLSKPEFSAVSRVEVDWMTADTVDPAKRLYPHIDWVLWPRA